MYNRAMRKVNEATISLIKSFEGFRSNPYPDPGTGAEPITIGFGTTVYPNGKKVTMTDPAISEEQALEFLSHEVNEKASAVEKLVKIELNDNEFGALVSFAYNVGIGNLTSSTLLKLLNANADRIAVADQFMRWTKAAGKVLPGLTRRRQAEKALFLQPITSDLDIPSDQEIEEKLKQAEEEILKG